MGYRYWYLVLVFVLAACIAESDRFSVTMETSTLTLITTSQSTSTSTPIPSLTPEPTINPFSKLPLSEGTLTPNPISEIEYAPWVWTAPNQKWAAVNKLSSLQIMHLSGQIIWEIPTQEMMRISRGGYWGSHGWSTDSRYFYFSLAPVIDPGVVFNLGTGLWRVDILSGEIEELLPPMQDFIFQAIHVPENLIAYIPWDEDGSLTVLDLNSGEEEMFQLNGDFDLAGNIVWSPNGSQLIYVGANNYDAYAPFDEKTLYSVILLNFENGDQSVIVEFEGDKLAYPSNWFEKNLLEFYRGCEVYYFDLDIKEFAFSATATPNPSVPQGYGCNP